MDERHVRPLSGEIMTAGTDATSCRVSEADVVDAEFETVINPAIASPAGESGRGSEARAPHPAYRAVADVTGMDSLRRDAARTTHPPGRRGGFAFWSCGIALAAAAFWVSGGYMLATPLLGALAAKQETLRIAELSSRVETHGGRKLLVIDGAVVNQGREPNAVPPLLIEVTGDAGRVTRYTLDAAGSGIAPGAEVRFSSRVDVPIGGVAGVSVRMSERSE